AAADKAAAEVEAQMKAAADAKAAADKAAAEADAKVKEATAVQATVAKAVTDAQNKAKPANVNLASPSPMVTLKITSAPITIAIAPPTTAVKQGATVELPTTISRLYGFADVVPLRAKIASDAKGLKVGEASLPTGQNQAKLSIEAAKDMK